jgi:hypothetical protein
MPTGATVARPRGVQAAASERTTTRALLAAGVAAGPVFLTVAAAQALTRDGYDLSRQPLSGLGPKFVGVMRRQVTVRHCGRRGGRGVRRGLSWCTAS